MLDERGAVLGWVEGRPALAALAFVAVYVAVAALAMPGAVVLSLIGGFLFGRWFGTLLVIVGATAGALVVFLVARSTLGGPLRRRAGALGDRIAEGMRGNAVEVLLVLRLVPVVPFFLVNLAAALFDVPVRTFVLTTAVGIAPAAFIYNGVGRQLGTVTSLDGLMSPGALATLLALAGLSLLPVAYRAWKRPSAAPAPKDDTR